MDHLTNHQSPFDALRLPVSSLSRCSGRASLSDIALAASDHLSLFTFHHSPLFTSRGRSGPSSSRHAWPIASGLAQLISCRCDMIHTHFALDPRPTPWPLFAAVRKGLSIILGARSILERCECAGWLTPVRRGKRLTLFKHDYIEAAQLRVSWGELP